MGQGNRFGERINFFDRPNECGNGKRNVYRGEEIILKTELNRRKQKVENEV